MANSFWTRTDRVMRWLHLYTGLFLVPWMAIYGTSAIVLNHGKWFNEHFVPPVEWKVIRELDFTPDESFPTGNTPEARKAQAGAILKHVDLDGPHFARPNPPHPKLFIHRASGAGHYMVKWHSDQSRIVVERQQPFSLLRLIHTLHFRHGYDRSYLVPWIWGLIVDVVGVSIWLWLVSGVYIWARRPKRRLLGGICLSAGLVLFAVLTAVLCM
jgi:hypothetical protein